MSRQYVSVYDMLWTEEGRRQLREWCEKTQLTGDAARWIKMLNRVEPSNG